VRELRNVIRRAILLASDVIEPAHLSVIPVDSPPTAALREELALGGCSLKETQARPARARRAARDPPRPPGHQWEQERAARLLRTDYKTLHVKMKQYGIDAGRSRSPPVLIRS